MLLIKERMSISFSKRCILCFCNYRSSDPLCSTCLQQLPRLQAPCLHCAEPLLTSTPPFCKNCLQDPPIVDQVNINYPFIEPLRTLIHRYKFTQGLYLTQLLGELMLNHSHPISLPQLFVPVPLHPIRLRQRGFNQSVMLARYLSRKLNVSYDALLCVKVKHTPPQATLTKVFRRTQLFDAFKIGGTPAQHIALVDDVYTTGTTVHTIAQLFKDQGVSRVDVWCVAKTLLGDRDAI